MQICEFWDINEKKWRLLDANDRFLKASSGLDVGFYLPQEHYEFAFEAWEKMRNTENFNPAQYEDGTPFIPIGISLGGIAYLPKARAFEDK